MSMPMLLTCLQAGDSWCQKPSFVDGLKVASVAKKLHITQKTIFEHKIKNKQIINSKSKINLKLYLE